MQIKSRLCNYGKIFFLLSIFFITNSILVFAELNVPEISSETHQNQVVNKKSSASINLGEVEGATHYLYQVTLSKEPEESKWIKTTNKKVLLTNLPEGKYNFFAKACSESACSDYSTFIIITDTKGPKTITGIKVFSTKRGLMLVWDEAFDESGIRNYFVYKSLKRNYGDREFKVTDLGVRKFETEKNYFLDDENSNKRVTYYYRIQAVDKAGNYGVISGIVIGRNDWQECEKPLLIKAESFGLKEARVEVESEEEISNVKAYLSLENQRLLVFSEKSPGKKFDFVMKPKENYFGVGSLEIEYSNSNNRICTQEKQIKIDGVVPQIKSVEKILKDEKIIFNVIAQDNDEIKKVELVKDGTLLAEGKKLKEETYEFSIEKNLFDNGLYVRVYDLVGNTIEEKIEFVQNTEPKEVVQENENRCLGIEGARDCYKNTEDDQKTMFAIIFASIIMLLIITIGMLYYYYSKANKAREKTIVEKKLEQTPRWKEKAKKQKQ